MAESKGPHRICEVCGNIADVHAFEPDTTWPKKSPLVSYFRGRDLCGLCLKTLHDYCFAPVVKPKRIENPALFINGIRTKVATIIPFYPLEKRPANQKYTCEACEKNEATELEPGTKPVREFMEAPAYYGAFYCKQCYDAIAGNENVEVKSHLSDGFSLIKRVIRPRSKE